MEFIGEEERRVSKQRKGCGERGERRLEVKGRKDLTTLLKERRGDG